VKTQEWLQTGAQKTIKNILAENQNALYAIVERRLFVRCGFSHSLSTG
jgi:ABC-type xylose transport system substrate-binding protein